MLTRRHFVRFAIAASVQHKSLSAQPDRPHEFGVQLYSVREMMGDLGKTLNLLRNIGYTSVETFSGLYDRPATDLKALTSDAGLKIVSGHFDYETLEEKVEYAKSLGLKYMICPFIPRVLWGSTDGFRQAATHLNKAAMKAHAAGVGFGYHPHNYEYGNLADESGFDILMRELDPSIRLELDIYWAVEAGLDPISVMQRNREHLSLIHIKDRKPTSRHSFDLDEKAAHFTEAGSGTIDWKEVLHVARQLGVEEFLMDQDDSDIPVEQSLRANLRYLSQLRF